METSPHFQETIFEDEPLSCAAVSLAPISAQLEEALVSMGSTARYGLRCCALCGKSNRCMCWLRIALRSAFVESTGYWMDWRKSATPENRSWWVLEMPERPINGSGASWLPTPTATEPMREQMADTRPLVRTGTGSLKGRKKNGKLSSTFLMDALRDEWIPTPLARDWKGRTAASRDSESLPDFIHRILPGELINPRFLEWVQGLPDGWTHID